MALLKIRGEQIQNGAIVNAHLGEAIQESNLAINWNAHTEILQDRKVVDWVQLNALAAGGQSSLDVTAQIGASTPRATSSGSEEGVIVDTPKNRVMIRDNETGDPLLDAQDREIYGRLTYDAVGGAFTLSFYVNNGGVDESVTLPAGAVIDVQYRRRFNLLSVSEEFAANEKWVDGAADVTAHLNIQQLARDLYGATYSLDRDGEPNRDRGVGEEVTAARGAYPTLSDRLAALGSDAAGVATDLRTYTAELDDAGVLRGFAVSEANPASMNVVVNVDPGSGDAVAYTGQGYRVRLAAAQTLAIAAADPANPRIDLVILAADGSGVSVLAGTPGANPTAPALPSGAVALAEVYVAAGATSIVNANITDRRVWASTGTEVRQARGSRATLADRLSVALRPDGYLVDDAKIHRHRMYSTQLAAATDVVQMPAGEYFVLASGYDVTLEVFVNGQLQAPGISYSEQTDAQGRGTGVQFVSPLQAGDVVILRWTLPNAN